MAELTPLLLPPTRIKVSSVLGRDTQSYGRQHLTDGSEETCWNSDQGSPQSITVDYGRAVHIHQILMMFQGGFVGQVCSIQGIVAAGHDEQSDGTYCELERIYPADCNALQISFLPLHAYASSYTFTLPDAVSTLPITRMKLIFEQSSDHYGRITLYQLEMLGQTV